MGVPTAELFTYTVRAACASESSARAARNERPDVVQDLGRERKVEVRPLRRLDVLGTRAEAGGNETPPLDRQRDIAAAVDDERRACDRVEVLQRLIAIQATQLAGDHVELGHGREEREGSR